VASGKMFRTVAVVLALGLFVGAARQAQAFPIEVSQESAPGAGDFNANVVGFIDPINSNLSAASYYAYDLATHSFNGPLTLISDTSHLFFVNSLIDGLSFFVVHDKRNDGSGGKVAMDIEIFNNPGGAVIRAADEPNEEVQALNPNFFKLKHEWDQCCTDGAAIGSLQGQEWSLHAYLTAPSTGMTSLLAISGSGSTLSLSLDPNRQVRFRVIPEPTTASLLMGLGVVALLRRPRRRAA